MNKNELVDLHRLLGLILENMKENSDVDVDEILDLEEYREMGVAPQGIHQTKTDQKEALLSLSQTLAKGIEEHGDEIDIIETEGDEEVDVNKMKDRVNKAESLAMNQSQGLSPSGTSDDKEEQDSEDSRDVGDDGVDWTQF